ncbi:MAG: hypothetical protein K0Q73_3112 [Paenibacillus sp.]|nr:hypothetical protein [Paenibacillus sp.]
MTSCMKKGKRYDAEHPFPSALCCFAQALFIRFLPFIILFLSFLDNFIHTSRLKLLHSFYYISIRINRSRIDRWHKFFGHIRDVRYFRFHRSRIKVKAEGRSNGGRLVKLAECVPLIRWLIGMQICLITHSKLWRKRPHKQVQ